MLIFALGLREFSWIFSWTSVSEMSGKRKQIRIIFQVKGCLLLKRGRDSFTVFDV